MLIRVQIGVVILDQLRQAASTPPPGQLPGGPFRGPFPSSPRPIVLALMLGSCPLPNHSGLPGNTEQVWPHSSCSLIPRCPFSWSRGLPFQPRTAHWWLQLLSPCFSSQFLVPPGDSLWIALSSRTPQVPGTPVSLCCWWGKQS